MHAKNRGRVPDGAHAPRLHRAALFVPIIVAVATLGLLLWSAWPVLRPARTVRVAQAVFDLAQASEPAAERPEQNAGPTGKTVQAAGWIEPEPYRIACAALADGVVQSVEVLEGDRVERGDPVARLVDEDAKLALRRAEAELGAARAALELARAELAAAESSWASPIELERAVEAGRALLEESRAELAQHPAMVDAARATLERLDEERARAEESLAGGAATDLEVIVARQRAATQRAEVAALQAREPLLRARVARREAELRAAERTLELRIEDRRRLEAARAEAAGAEAGLELAMASHDTAALDLERMTVRAPADGVVLRRLKAPGDKVVRGMDDPYSAHIVHLYDPQRVQVRVDVSLADAAGISIGQRCEVVVEALPDRVLEGEVIRIDQQADIQKNTLGFKVRVLDPPPILRPEMLTRVKFLPGRTGLDASGDRGAGATGRVLVPRAALGGRDGARMVWVIEQRRNGRGVLRSAPVVPLGDAPEGWVGVSGDIRPGSLVALWTPDLQEGERVAIGEEATEAGP